jgi:glycosyltransferase involved in cell wall biosynthesis
MDKTARKRIGIFFTIPKRGGMGGLIYIINLIKCLRELPDKEKPFIVLLCDPRYNDILQEIITAKYPYIEYISCKPKSNIMLIYLFSFLLRKNFFIANIVSKHKLQGLFPFNDFPVSTFTKNCTLVSWFPDFQHKFYPAYFTKRNLILREQRFQWVFKRTHRLVLSSQSAYNHYMQFSKSRQAPVHILRFVSVVHDREIFDINKLKEKYKLDRPYFIVCNQFYKHKNHILIFKAIEQLKNKCPDLLIVFTGRMADYRNSEFINSLKAYITENALEQYCSFLGIIDRGEQLCLMQNAIAVIQPSMFEGWSTVIEDAKSLQVQVIASDFDVHIEQLEDKAYYFGQESVNELAHLIQGFYEKTISLKPYFLNYTERILEYARGFVRVFEQ